MKIIEDLKGYPLFSFVLGTAVFVFLATFAYNNGVDWLAPFASVGVLYIGYKSKNTIQGVLFGAFSGVFLGIATIYGALGPINYGANPDLMTAGLIITCILTGAIVSFVGAYFNGKRKKAIEIESNKKNSKNTARKKPVKTGDLKSDIKNLFKKR